MHRVELAEGNPDRTERRGKNPQQKTAQERKGSSGVCLEEPASTSRDGSSVLRHPRGTIGAGEGIGAT